MPILAASGLRKRYGAVEVLKGVSFAIEKQRSFAVIGPNGAGKTTLMKVVTGEIFADAGQVRLAERDVTRQGAHLRVRAGVGRTFQVARVFPQGSVLDNAIVAIEARRRNTGQSLGPWRAIQPIAEIRDEAEGRLREIGLETKRDDPAAALAHGDRKRLELVLALALEPILLVLDEPTAGMSPAERHRTVALIAELKASKGLTLLLTEHDMGVVNELADRLMVLNYGAVVAEGTAEEIRANPIVREVYLGQEMVHAQGH